MEQKVCVPLFNPDELLKVYEAIHYDYPEIKLVWWYKESKYSIRQIVTSRKEMTLYIKYYGSYDFVKQRLQNIELKAAQIIEICLYGEKITDDEIIRRICTYMAGSYRYADRQMDGEYPEYAYTLECLVRGEGVCAGFSSALTYILRMLQILVMTVAGKANGMYFFGHAWNIVRRSDGTYWHIDLTWDLEHELEKPQYFELDDGAMRARSHYWNGIEYPICGGMS